MAIDLATGEVERLLKEGQAAARSGDMAAARTLLTQVVERDPHNEKAWMWLSGVVVEPEEQQICLENVLVINPQNTKARKGLEYISTKTGISPSVSAAAVSSTDTSTEPLSSDFSVFGDNLAGMSPGMPPMDASQLTLDATDASSFQAEQSVSAFDGVPAWAQPMPGAQPQASPFGAPMQWPAANGAEPAPDPAPQFGDGQLRIDSSPMPDAYSMQVMDQGAGEPGLAVDVQPFSVDATLSAIAEPKPGAYDPSASLTDSGLPPWSIDPRVPAFDGSGILQLDDSDTLQSMPPFHATELTSGAVHMESGAFQAMNVAPAGPHFAAELPAPTELPGYTGALGDQAQPWYLQSQQESAPKPVVETGDHSGYAPGHPEQTGSSQHDAHGNPASAAMIDCPNCKQKSTDTSMACANCHFSFFVNCPHCHELIDVSDAQPDHKEACPQCSTPISRMSLGLQGVVGAPSYQSIPLKGSMVGGPAMQSRRVPSSEHTRTRTRISFRWLVDVAWLVVIIGAVWALTQLPVWLRWTGQY
jgi:hypothetical protein